MHFPLIMPSTQDTHLPIPGICEFVRIRTVLVWAAITEYHKLDGLNNRNLFLTVLEDGKSKIKALENQVQDLMSGESLLAGS